AIPGVTKIKDGYNPATDNQQDLVNILGGMYDAVLFHGASNASAVQSIVSIERATFYRERAIGMYLPLPYAFAQVIRAR
ncbi:hypothetical protein GIB67_001897, partial [Kingdonia uniflora]